jgi:hypothetical protein
VFREHPMDFSLSDDLGVAFAAVALIRIMVQS